ncbi:DUF1501 domain-containing protein [Fimbriiglobus ruber]|uniref:DUF1501 domain-containing protein n=1 Tax=Fimbriiglobus ruber TaxID=1908690 RepID=A0A225DZ17_9BACT|nr:DUF1501 domain-containing protein [Fimbriiglobus ruber]OWK46770.1 hypothetical protein FRUB_00469 [Fimbriiglobus ruber]
MNPTRRRMLKIGATGLIGGLSLPRLLQLQAGAPTPAPAAAQACIFLFLEGGPSHIDMFDMKPDAPQEIRGPYKPVATSVPGTRICEHLPRIAKLAHKYTILRSHSHNDNGHNTGYHYVMTGYKADFPDGNSKAPNNHLFPSIGSIISRELGPKSPVPPYINVPDVMAGGGPGFYGSKYAPFVIDANPSQPDFEVRDLKPIEGIDAERRERRRKLLAAAEAPTAKGRQESMETYYRKAQELITSPAARKAFDIASEPAALREKYGYTSLGQCALLARRLVEGGCRFVGVDHSGWDHHFTIFPSLEKDMLPHVDRAFSALVEDLDQRGLLDTTLVVLMGEMGRTPRVNKDAGRDHWSMAQSVVFAGGGTKPGQVIGATDKQAGAPTTDPVGVPDLLRTIFHQMGVDTTKVYNTPQGRPVPIVDGGKLIKDLV